MQPPSELSGVLLKLAYHGQLFSGWAPQATERTVAGELLGALRALDPRASELRGVSRTDAGVHALGQLASFDTTLNMPPRGWVLGVARHLPDEIAIVQASRVEAGFDPRRHVRSKRYLYRVLESAVRDPFLEGRAWRIKDRLNHLAMTAAAAQLLGRHDFRAFRAVGDTREDTVRRLFRVDVERARSDDRIWEIRVEGDRFLYKMVRIIAGALVDIGRGRIDANAVARALESKVRTHLGVTAPADGLYLDEIELDRELSEPWPG